VLDLTNHSLGVRISHSLKFHWNYVMIKTLKRVLMWP